MELAFNLDDSFEQEALPPHGVSNLIVGERYRGAFPEELSLGEKESWWRSLSKKLPSLSCP